MDIFEQWKKIEEEKFNHSPIKREDIMESIYQKSTSTMETLKTRLKYKMAWIIFFTLMFFSLLIWHINNLSLVTIFGIAGAIYLIGFIQMRKFYLQMGSERKEGSTLKVLRNNYKMITKALKFEKNLFIPVMPLMIIGGFLTPGLVKGDNLFESLSDPTFLIVMLIAVVILTPMAIFLSDKMNKGAYGAYIDKLKNNITEMEKVA